VISNDLQVGRSRRASLQSRETGSPLRASHPVTPVFYVAEQIDGDGAFCDRYTGKWHPSYGQTGLSRSCCHYGRLGLRYLPWSVVVA